jgi:hypothetical protein
MENTPASHESPVHAHEATDLSIRAIIWFAVGLVLAGIVVHFALGGFWSLLLYTREPAARLSPFAAPRQLPPTPRLQISPPADLKTFRDAEKQKTETYGWINRPTGMVRIPVQRAMDLVLERGLPQATPKPQGAQKPQGEQEQ